MSHAHLLAQSSDMLIELLMLFRVLKSGIVLLFPDLIESVCSFAADIKAMIRARTTIRQASASQSFVLPTEIISQDTSETEGN